MWVKWLKKSRLSCSAAHFKKACIYSENTQIDQDLKGKHRFPEGLVGIPGQTKGAATELQGKYIGKFENGMRNGMRKFQIE